MKFDRKSLLFTKNKPKSPLFAQNKPKSRKIEQNNVNPRFCTIFTKFLASARKIGQNIGQFAPSRAQRTP